ncbi:hypothetical protein D5S18_00770 [Nocardia panacis]|uniref:Uncharacterized protein n=2 Tax=Nocardia panacis TaxID=2340916 RepID=A0A3A4KIZ6_9NOCA|nr:hypothetical protein D5S18_00770 [Nocardia panacis]
MALLFERVENLKETLLSEFTGDGADSYRAYGNQLQNDLNEYKELGTRVNAKVSITAGSGGHLQNADFRNAAMIGGGALRRA